MLRKFVCFSIYILMVVLFMDNQLLEVRAEEPIEAYLEALQDRGYTDVAVRYLDRMASSPLASDQFRDEVEYRKGMLLVTSARSSKSSSRRQSQLDRAKQALDQFLKQHPDHPNIVLARNQLGNILVERARSLSLRAQGDNVANREALKQQAYDAFEEAFQSLSESKLEIGERYKALAANRDPETKAQVSQVRAQYIQTYLALGRVLFEQAKVVDGNEKRYREKLTAAAQAFDEVATKYRAYSAGLYATLYQGECYQLLGEDQRALSYYKELLQTSDNSAPVRRLKTTALARSIDGWLKTDPKNGPERSIQVAEEWIKTKRGTEDRTANWLDFRLSLAKAQFAKSKIATGDKQAERALKAAREIAQEVAKRKSDVQIEAQQLLVALGNGEAPAIDVSDVTQLNSFAEARDAAKRSLDAMKLNNTTIKILSSQLKQIRNPDRKSEIELKLQEAESEKAAQSSATLSLFQRADSLATADDLTDLHSVRYYLGYLYYTLKDYRRAAVIASHTALNYPDSVAAKECANVAIAARQRLYQELPPEDREAQMNGIAEIGELMVSKWPDDPQAASALTTLLDVAIAKGDVDQAKTYLSRIPNDSPKRAIAELRLGQKLWSEYLQRALRNTDSEANAPDSRHSDLKIQALEMLKQGIARSAGKAPNESAIRGALSLAKIYVDSGQPIDALELLNQTDIGTIQLAESGSPWLEKIPGLSIDGYTTAIRAHIASAASAADSRASIAAAQQMLESLRADLKDQPDGKARMIGIYVSLARDLERQLAVASPVAQAALSQGFESFLRKAAEGSDDITVLNWVADTFYGMGNGLIQGGKLSSEAQRYFTAATKAYDQVLAAAEQDPALLPSNAVQQIYVRQAMALRQVGNYQKSIDLFAKVLATKRFLNMQIEAAKTLQQWGTLGDNENALTQAIRGSRPGADGKNLIWGWGRIAKLVAREDKYRDTFHDARYNIAKCRYELSKKQSGKSQQAGLSRAKSDLIATQKLYGLGTPDQKKRYETLMKSIQTSLGEPASGFSK